MTVITMSRKELSRLQILIGLADGRTRVDEAAALMGMGRRQVYRLLDAFREHGADALISKRRGKPSNRAHGAVFRRTCLAIVRERYEDFGPTLAAEKLAEVHGLPVGVETLRQWMIEDGIWVRRRDRIARVHQPRHRRDCLGELVQVDGCEHWWFEDRGPQCTLLVFVDDATSRLMHLSFVASESAFSYFQATRSYLEDHGKPIALYSDKHSVFRINRTDAASGGDMTQFGRALHELNIDILCANAPQAKGRVERAHKTLQDRLVKELRLAGANDIDAGNALLPAFMADYNRRFAKPARNDKDLHRPLAPQDNLDNSFAWRVERTVTNSLTVQYDRVMFILEPNEITRALPRKKVTVYDFPDGRIEVRHQGLALPYRTFDRITRVDQGAIVENKRLSEALEMCRAMQAELPPKLRSRKAPARTAQAEHMFSAIR
jgi:transposase